MSRLFINAIGSISAQEEDFFESGVIKEYHQNIIPALEQDYKAYIKPMLLRRMSKAVRMGLLCSKKVLRESGISIPDAIITGTGQGCMQDTEKFMEQMLDSNEGLLSPTSFIQSTHNTVGGQIALDLNCTGYNMTYTQNSASFESALADALTLAEEVEYENFLVGGVEEVAETLTKFEYFDGQLKQEEIRNIDLFNSESPGTITSENACFFLLNGENTTRSYAEVKAVKILNTGNPDYISSKIDDFLSENNYSRDEVDILILGKNGDIRFDEYYLEVQRNFVHTAHLAYKHLVGDNHTISSYSLWLAAKILKTSQIPEILKINRIKCEAPKRILLYNQYLGRNHGLILLEKP